MTKDSPTPAVPGAMAMTIAEEVTALANICDEFEKFDERTANRVIWYLTDRYITNRKAPQPAPTEGGKGS